MVFSFSFSAATGWVEGSKSISLEVCMVNCNNLLPLPGTRARFSETRHQRVLIVSVCGQRKGD
jgi:hypothetical protein